jgi:phosphoribosylformimino-5-aminoimidazole carboxamide ribotide isomerase
MRLIPVLDLKRGVVVRGVGGRRDEYRPVESVVSRSADPVDVACGLRERFGFREFYIADLDAIAGAALGRAARLVRRDLVLVDAGLRDVAAGRAL